MSGYTSCACRDCFDISMDGDLCVACTEAGCYEWPGEGAAAESLRQILSFECQREDAYGVGEDDNDA